jgi:hypothetical protein
LLVVQHLWWSRRLRKSISALHHLWGKNRLNISQLQSWQQLRQDLARKKFSELRHSVHLAGDFLGGMVRGSFGHLSERQRSLLTNTTQELNLLDQSLVSMFSQKAEMLNIEDVRICEMRESLKQNRHFQTESRLRLEVLPESELRAALHPIIFAKALDELIAGSLQNAIGQDVRVRLSDSNGSEISQSMESDARYCHIQIQYAIPYLERFTPMLDSFADEAHFQVDLSLMFMKEICSWLGGRAWVDFPAPNTVVVHIAIPAIPMMSIEKAS